uniref:Integral membrane protein n=1 Tax=Streptomyces sp. NBC_00003 TaxID=2903608 RepID=A0AAU2V1H0_9ACTN
MNATPATTKTDAETEPKTDAEAETEATSTPGGATAETAPEATEAPAAQDLEDGLSDDDDDADELDDEPVPARPAFGAGAAAVVAGALGAVSLSGTWMGKTLSERATLIGQIKTSQSSTAAQQIQEIYGNSWHTTALVNGVFALLALIVGAFVLARPAFGTPGRAEQPVWVKAVALAGVVLGVIGLLISAGMYLDLFAALPSTKG